MLFEGVGENARQKTFKDLYLLWRVAERWQTKFPHGVSDVVKLDETTLARYVAYEQIRMEEYNFR